jgi:hypothetical protein
MKVPLVRFLRTRQGISDKGVYDYQKQVVRFLRTRQGISDKVSMITNSKTVVNSKGCLKSKVFISQGLIPTKDLARVTLGSKK